MKFTEIKKTSRTGKYGRNIECPHCGHVSRVYHFSWCATTCLGCGRMVEKYEYKMEAR